MIPYFIVCLASLVAAGLTLYSGFGLGTLLMPVFALFFPVEVAVAATAMVHGANNLFKLAMVGRHADRSLVLGFGLPAIVAAFAGATALGYLAHLGEIASYAVGGRVAVITPLKLSMGVLMLGFALCELAPGLRGLRFDRRYLVAGGVLSGFFGGFSGHQGALRAAFLTRVGLSTEAFVGTSAVIGSMVDLARLSVYAALLVGAGDRHLAAGQWPLILCGTLAAFAGVLIAKRFLRKITMQAVQGLTGILLLGIGLALGAGLL
ncbi:MAG: TSUP family transporter [Thermodesulfobacteriota bacterium]